MAEELNEWLSLAQRAEAQANGPMFQPDFKITDEVRKDFQDMFGSFKIEENEGKEKWQRYGDWKSFLTASEDELRKWLKSFREDLLDEVKVAQKNQADDDFISRKITFLGKDKGSSERVEEIEKLRKESAVQDVIYRGQDAYEVLDSKKAAQIIKDSRKDERARGIDSGYRKGVGYTGSEGDGLYHLTPHGTYAASYGGSESPRQGVIQGVLVSKRLLDLTPVTAGGGIYYSKNNTEYWNRREKYFGKGTSPAVSGWEVNGVGPTYEQVKAFNEAKHDKDYTNSEFFGRMGKAEYEKFVWCGAIADTIAKNYERVNGKPMPQNIGLPKKSTDTSSLQERIYADMDKRNDVTYQVLKTPTFKKVMKEAGFDAVKYLDYGVGRTTPTGTPAYGATKPTQFKSYFGNKKVDLTAPNMFDAD